MPQNLVPKPHKARNDVIAPRVMPRSIAGPSTDLPAGSAVGTRRLDPGSPHGAAASQAHRPLRLYPAPASNVDTAGDALRKFVFDHGQYFDSYLATEPGRMSFWSGNGEGLISYTRRGRHLLVGGGLIAAGNHRATLLEEFVTSAKRNRLHVAFHNIGDDDLPEFRRLGFQITKWGEEPIVDLGSCTWAGKPYEWVRRQTNFCVRNGLVAFEVDPGALEPGQWARTRKEILEVSAESLSQKAQSEPMRFFEGRIDNHDLGLRRLFIARSAHGAGRIEGFVVCNPIRGGAMWATELYRRRLDSVRGTMAFLIHHALRQLQAEGVQGVALCLDPGLRCEAPLPGDSALVRLGMQFSMRHFSGVFDVAGLRHFKSRFRPRYENRYVCSFPRVSLGALIAFARVSGLFNLNPARLARVCFDHWRKGALRKSLADAA